MCCLLKWYYDNFVKNEDKGSFAGMVIYTIPQLNFIVRANRYVNDVKVEGIFIPSKQDNLEERVKVLKSIHDILYYFFLL